jgi:glycosyltransferase involved in cell wall biosynthesis
LTCCGSDWCTKVALISNEGGGISSVTAGLASSLAKRKIETTIFTGITNSDGQTEKLNDYLEIVRLPIPDFPPRNVWFQILHLKKLAKALSNYTVVHGMSHTASFGLTFFEGKTPRPFVATIHDSYRPSQRVFISGPLSSWTLFDIGYFFMEYPLYDFSMNRVLSISNHVTFCSHTVLSEVSAFKRFDHSKTSVIYNGIDFDEIESVKKPETEKTNSISILFAGRLFWFKGVMLLLEAFNRLKVAEDVHLNIFGSGPMRQKIEKFIIDYGLKDRVSFPGRIPHRKLIGEIKNSDIVALPSFVEAQPMIFLEAMACRKPVVAFDLPYSRELVSNMKNGLLAKAGDVNDLARKLELLVSDGALRHEIGQSAYCQVKKNHDWDIQADKYLRVYEGAIETNDKMR